jgi:hypothetical protein
MPDLLLGIDCTTAAKAVAWDRGGKGSPANVAVGLARLGVPVRLLARIADDPLGRRIRAHLTGNGVDLSHTVRAQEPTSLAIVALGEGGVPEYDFRIQGTADWQWRDAELAGVLDGRLVALHAGSLALTMPPGAEVLARLVRRHSRGGQRREKVRGDRSKLSAICQQRRRAQPHATPPRYGRQRRSPGRVWWRARHRRVMRGGRTRFTWQRPPCRSLGRRSPGLRPWLLLPTGVRPNERPAMATAIPVVAVGCMLTHAMGPCGDRQ